MIPLRVGALLALVGAAQPAFAASLQPFTVAPRFGAAGKAYLRVPLGRGGGDGPHVGLTLAASRQDRGLAGNPVGGRRDADAIGLRLDLDGRASLMLAGAPAYAAVRHNARDDGARHSPWRTVAFVVGGLAIAAGATFAYIVHEAEKNSD